MTSPITNKEWEKEFDEIYNDYEISPFIIIDFITKLLSAQKQSIIQEIDDRIESISEFRLSGWGGEVATLIDLKDKIK